MNTLYNTNRERYLTRQQRLAICTKSNYTDITVIRMLLDRGGNSDE